MMCDPSFLIIQEMCLKFSRKTLLPKMLSTMVPTFLLSAIYFSMFSVRQKFILTLQLEQVKTFLLDRKTKYPRRDRVTESMKNVNIEEKAFRIKAEEGFSKNTMPYFHSVLRHRPRSSRISFSSFSLFSLPSPSPLCLLFPCPSLSAPSLSSFSDSHLCLST